VVPPAPKLRGNQGLEFLFFENIIKYFRIVNDLIYELSALHPFGESLEKDGLIHGFALKVKFDLPIGSSLGICFFEAMRIVQDQSLPCVCRLTDVEFIDFI